MSDTNDELEARRWFRWRLAELGTEYPQLKAPWVQERLTEAIDRIQEDLPWQELESPEDGPQAPAD